MELGRRRGVGAERRRRKVGGEEREEEAAMDGSERRGAGQPAVTCWFLKLFPCSSGPSDKNPDRPDFWRPGA